MQTLYCFKLKKLMKEDKVKNIKFLVFNLNNMSFSIVYISEDAIPSLEWIFQRTQ